MSIGSQQKRRKHAQELPRELAAEDEDIMEFLTDEGRAKLPFTMLDGDMWDLEDFLADRKGD